MKELARLCGTLLLRGAAWGAYTLVLIILVAATLRAWDCADGCEKLTVGEILITGALTTTVLAISSILAMLLAAALTRRWLARRPGDRRWLVTGTAYTLLTLPLVTAATLTALAAVTALSYKNGGVSRMDTRVRALESDVRALMLAVGALGAQEARFLEPDAAASRACAEPVGRDQ